MHKLLIVSIYDSGCCNLSAFLPLHAKFSKLPVHALFPGQGSGLLTASSDKCCLGLNARLFWQLSHAWRQCLPCLLIAARANATS